MLTFATLGAVAALVEIAFPAAVNNAAPGTDSMQTWTCQWASAENSPNEFSALCHESVCQMTFPMPFYVPKSSLSTLTIWHDLAVCLLCLDPGVRDSIARSRFGCPEYFRIALAKKIARGKGRGDGLDHGHGERWGRPGACTW